MPNLPQPHCLIHFRVLAARHIEIKAGVAFVMHLDFEGTPGLPVFKQNDKIPQRWHISRHLFGMVLSFGNGSLADGAIQNLFGGFLSKGFSHLLEDWANHFGLKPSFLKHWNF